MNQNMNLKRPVSSVNLRRSRNSSSPSQSNKGRGSIIRFKTYQAGQEILNKNSSSFYGSKYTLVSGRASIRNRTSNQPLYSFKQNQILNLTEVNFKIPLLKSIVAETNACVIVQPNEQNSAEFRRLKQEEQGLSPISIFRDMKPWLYCELTRYIQMLQLRSNHILQPRPRYLYFIMEGTISIKQKQNQYTLVHICPGQLFKPDKQLEYIALNTKCQLICICEDLLNQILATDEYKQLQSLLQTTRKIIDARLNFFMNVRKQHLFLTKKRAFSQKRVCRVEQAHHKFITDPKSIEQSRSQNQKQIRKRRNWTVHQQKQKFEETRNRFHEQLRNMSRYRYGKAYLVAKRKQINAHINEPFKKLFQNEDAGAEKIKSQSQMGSSGTMICNLYKTTKRDYSKESISKLNYCRFSKKIINPLKEARRVQQGLQKKSRYFFKHCFEKSNNCLNYSIT